MSTPQEPGPPALDALPFYVLLWVAGADDDIDPEEIEVFHKMLDRRAWCRSEAAHRVFPRTAAAYSALWKAHGAKSRDLAPVHAGLIEATAVFAPDDLARFKQDLAKLADAIARAVAAAAMLGSQWHPVEAREAGKVSARVERFSLVGITEEQARYARALEVGRYVARDITGTEPERMAPARVAELCAQAFAGTSVRVSVEHDVRAYPLLSAVARASMVVERHRPCVVRLEYAPPEGSGAVERTSPATEPAPPFSDALAATTPAVLHDLIFTMLEKDPGARPQSLDQVVNVLETLSAQLKLG